MVDDRKTVLSMSIRWRARQNTHGDRRSPQYIQPIAIHLHHELNTPAQIKGPVPYSSRLSVISRPLGHSCGFKKPPDALIETAGNDAQCSCEDLREESSACDDVNAHTS